MAHGRGHPIVVPAADRQVDDGAVRLVTVWSRRLHHEGCGGGVDDGRDEGACENGWQQTSYLSARQGAHADQAQDT